MRIAFAAYNGSFTSPEVKRWFRAEGFDDIVLTATYSINMRGRRSV